MNRNTDTTNIAIDDIPFPIAIFTVSDSEYLFKSANSAFYSLFYKLIEANRLTSLDKFLKEIEPDTSKHTNLYTNDGLEVSIDNEGGLSYYNATSFRTSNLPADELLSVVLTDITQYKKSQISLKKSEERFKILSFLTSDSASSLSFNPDGSFHRDWSNMKLLRQFGYDPEDVDTFEKWSNIIHPEDKALYKSKLDELLKGNKSSIEIRLIAKNGDVKWVENNIYPKFDTDSNKVTGLISAVRDITGKMIAGRQIDEERKTLSTVINKIGDAVITLSPDGKIILFNQKATELTGFSDLEAIGSDFKNIVLFKSSEFNSIKNITLSIKNGRLGGNHEPKVIINKYGEDRIIREVFSIIKDVDGKIKMIVVILNDLTEHELIRKELVRLDKVESINILAAGIAHDFNNILTAIMGNITLAKILSDQENLKLQKALLETEKASFRAKKLTGQLMNFSKINTPEKRIINLSEVVKDSSYFAVQGSNVSLNFCIAPDIKNVEADEGQITQVISNIVLNSVQAMPEGGTVNIVAENIYIRDSKTTPLSNGSYIKISIKDSGQGIPQNLIGKIFDPFFTTKDSGNGLGLSMAYNIIKNHRGYISVHSTPGQGTIFSIYLPTINRAADSTSTENISQNKFEQSEGSILVMDDEEMIRLLANQILSLVGYKVYLAANGSEAIELYESIKPDLVILDLTIPAGMGGRETALRILEIDSDARIVISSGYSDDPILKDYREYGILDFLPKPYNAEEMITHVNRIFKIIKNK